MVPANLFYLIVLTNITHQTCDFTMNTKNQTNFDRYNIANTS